jgi:biopolymer transport protein ExbD
MAVKMRNMRLSERFARMKLFNRPSSGRSSAVFINVTALVDMMTVLVIFLVMQFNATGEMLFISKDLAMAKALHGKELTRVPILSLDAHSRLYYEGVMLIDQIKPTVAGEEPTIAMLQAKLDDNRRRSEALNGPKKADEAGVADPTTTVNVQIDKNLDFAVVKRVLFTCEKAGYNRIRLAVNLDSPTAQKAEIKL